jgi:uncharacterized membrane protein YeaQ/YmgE (transglycosylase-associated protein family)
LRPAHTGRLHLQAFLFSGSCRAAGTAFFEVEMLSDRSAPCRTRESRHGSFSSEKSMMSLIGTLIVGLIVGLIARAIKPGDDSLGWIMTALLGVAGAFLASYVGVALGWYEAGQPAGWIASIVGAIVILFIYGLVRGKSAR